MRCTNEMCLSTKGLVLQVVRGKQDLWYPFFLLEEGKTRDIKSIVKVQVEDQEKGYVIVCQKCYRRAAITEEEERDIEVLLDEKNRPPESPQE